MTTKRRNRYEHKMWSISILLLLLVSTASSQSNVPDSHDDTTPITTHLKGSSNWETCSSHTTCTECYDASSTCHWCDVTGCHVKGNLIHGGCAKGVSCNPEQDKKDKEANQCDHHKTCASCSNFSVLCHWCSSDEACHALGSMHGCAAGENCYAIDRCQRLEPERIEDGGTFSKASFAGVGPVAKFVLGLMMGLVLCCSTMCFGGATFLKCAVDDLVGEPVEIVEEEIAFGVDEGGSVGGGGEQQHVEMIEGQDNELSVPLMQNDTLGKNAEEGEANEDVNAAEESGNGGDEFADEHRFAKSVLHRSDVAHGRDAVASLARSTVSATRHTQPKPSSVRRMYCACQLCYLVTIITTIILFIVGMSYAPRQPEYNVCTNELAWKSIVEGMASLKMSASFDLLISVYNPNRFEVDLSNGVGQFHHDGEYVGSFDIPEGRISEKAISDIVVKVTFTPDKWSALSLTSEYYRGNLKFVVGGHARVKVPALGYQFDAKFDDIRVNVNDPSLDETHLCACPGWKKPIEYEL